MCRASSSWLATSSGALVAAVSSVVVIAALAVIVAVVLTFLGVLAVKVPTVVILVAELPLGASQGPSSLRPGSSEGVLSVPPNSHKRGMNLVCSIGLARLFLLGSHSPTQCSPPNTIFLFFLTANANTRAVRFTLAE